jgi:hypothetical protein
MPMAAVRGYPEAGGGRQSAHPPPLLKYQTRGQKTHSGHDLRRDTARISAMEPVDRDESKKRRAQAHQTLGAHAHRFSASFPLVAQYGAEHRGDDEAREEFHLNV